MKWTKFNKIFGTFTRICYSISSFSVAIGLLSISVTLGRSIHFIGTYSTCKVCKIIVNTPAEMMLHNQLH